jgi:hypothetical protein
VYARSRILYRSYIEQESEAARKLRIAQQPTPIETDATMEAAAASSSVDASAGTAAIAAASSASPLSFVRTSASFPSGLPLPAYVFTLSASVIHLSAHLRAQRQRKQPQGDAAVQSTTAVVTTEDASTHMQIDGVDAPTSEAAQPMDIVTEESDLPKTAHAPSSVAAPIAISSIADDGELPLAIRIRPQCARPTCAHTRRYTDAHSQLPMCSLDCLTRMRGTDAFTDAVARVHAQKHILAA